MDNASDLLSNSGILIVDDQRAARMLLNAFLVRIGVGRVEEATDGLEALRMMTLAKKNRVPFSAIFISRMLRELSGLELVGNIRRIEEWANFPIVIVSEDLNQGYVRDAMTVGADEYLLRPYTEEHLQEITLRAIRKNSTP